MAIKFAERQALALHKEGSLLSVSRLTLDKICFAECLPWTLGKALFAECLPWDTRQSIFKKLKQSLSSDCQKALSKDSFAECQIEDNRQNIFLNLKITLPSARSQTLGKVVTPHPIPGLAVLTPGSSLGSYIVPTDQHESFVRTLSSVMRTRENFPVGHRSQIAPSQARLTWRFFRDRLQKKDAPCWYGYSINSIKPWARISPSQGPGHHNPLPLEILSHPGSRGNQNPGVRIITMCARTKSHTYDDS
jgi:hypothetical protein